MPIVNCFTSCELHSEKLENLVKTWSKNIHVSEKDITINFISNYVQKGQDYKILAFLYLPSLWSPKSIRTIQKTLFDLLLDTFSVDKNDVCILTNIIGSGCVMEGGKEITWIENENE